MAPTEPWLNPEPTYFSSYVSEHSLSQQKEGITNYRHFTHFYSLVPASAHQSRAEFLRLLHQKYCRGENLFLITYTLLMFQIEESIFSHVDNFFKHFIINNLRISREEYNEPHGLISHLQQLARPGQPLFHQNLPHFPSLNPVVYEANPRFNKFFPINIFCVYH